MLKPGTFRFKAALNASTLMPFKLSIPEQIRVCREAGYEAIELWSRDIMAYIQSGGVLDDIRKQARDSGISIPNCISFIKWADADASIRRSEIEEAKKELENVKRIGCDMIAAPPYGDTDFNSTEAYAEYFAQLYDVGADSGVEPCLEIWGHRGNIRTIAQAQAILEKSGVEEGKVLIDPIHIYKGGGSFRDVSNLSANSIGMVHVNDYPIHLPNGRELNDRDRCFPGDGEAELDLFKEMLLKTGYKEYLSLELFIADYGDQTPVDAASYGIESIFRVFA